MRCESNYQCPVNFFCWYKSASDKNENNGAGIKKCLKLYEGEDGDTFGWLGNYDLASYTQNGKFCKSGLAYNSAKGEAKCTKTLEITHPDETGPLEAPYKCKPANSDKKCKINMDI